MANLPKVGGNADGEVTGYGSVAYTQDLAKTYLLGPDDVWREV